MYQQTKKLTRSALNLFSVNISNTVSANQTFFGLKSPPINHRHDDS